MEIRKTVQWDAIRSFHKGNRGRIQLVQMLIEGKRTFKYIKSLLMENT